jgi:hypothetical protein
MAKHFDIEKHLREDLEVTSPSPDFSGKVMGAIAGTHIAPASRTYINKKVVYGMGLFFLLLVAGAVAYAVPSFNWSATGRLLPTIDPGKLDISRYFTGKTLNCMLFLNVILGLIFLDKYFVRKPRAL